MMSRHVVSRCCARLTVAGANIPIKSCSVSAWGMVPGSSWSAVDCWSSFWLSLTSEEMGFLLRFDALACGNRGPSCSCWYICGFNLSSPAKGRVWNICLSDGISSSPCNCLDWALVMASNEDIFEAKRPCLLGPWLVVLTEGVEWDESACCSCVLTSNSALWGPDGGNVSTMLVQRASQAGKLDAWLLGICIFWVTSVGSWERMDRVVYVSEWVRPYLTICNLDKIKILEIACHSRWTLNNNSSVINLV